MEGYVIAAHVVAAGWLAAMVMCAAAVRREAREGVRAPGRVTLTGLAAVALFVAAGLAWHPLFTPVVFATWLASFALFPTAVVWWSLSAVGWWRHPASSDEEWQRRLGRLLTGSWVSLTLLLPAVLAWVWVDRVEWVVF